MNEWLERVPHMPTIVAYATPQQGQNTVAHAMPQRGLCPAGPPQKPERVSRARWAESKPCRGASRTVYPSRTAAATTATARAARGKPGIEAKRIVAPGSGEGL